MENWLGQLVNICQTLCDKVQANLPSACGEAAERVRFSQHGHGPGPGPADHEMSSFRSFEKPEGVSGPSGAFTEFGGQPAGEYETCMNGPVGEIGEGGLKPGVKISEWQAGWNITNAIQVLLIKINLLFRFFSIC